MTGGGGELVKRLAAVASLALLWTAMAGRLTGGSLLLGLAAGALVVVVLGVRPRRVPRPHRIFRWLAFVLYYLWEVVRSNVRLAILVLAPQDRLRSGVIEIPLDLESEFELVLLSNLITFTPGSLVVDVSDDRRVMYVHVIGHEPPEQLRESLEGLARRVARLDR